MYNVLVTIRWRVARGVKSVTTFRNLLDRTILFSSFWTVSYLLGLYPVYYSKIFYIHINVIITSLLYLYRSFCRWLALDGANNDLSKTNVIFTDTISNNGTVNPSIIIVNGSESQSQIEQYWFNSTELIEHEVICERSAGEFI